MPISVAFARRRNRDSSIDSIRTGCYQTVASSQREKERERELAVAEEVHVCNPNRAYASQHADSLQEPSRLSTRMSFL